MSLPQRGRPGSGSCFQLCSCTLGQTNPVRASVWSGLHRGATRKLKRGGEWSSLEVRYLRGHHKVELQSSRWSFLMPFCSSFLLLPLFFPWIQGRKWKTQATSKGRMNTMMEPSAIRNCEHEPLLTHLPFSQWPNSAVKREYLGEAPAHGGHGFYHPQHPALPPHLCSHKFQGKKLILKILTHPNSGFGWLVSLMCCQISSPVISAIIWDKSTVTGQWIFKGRVTPCRHTKVCTALDKVPRRPEWNRSWNSESSEVLVE